MVRKFAVSILLVLAFLIVTTSSTAAKTERVGTQINLRSGTPSTFPAGAPFHIAHGWTGPVDTGKGLAGYDIELEVDSVLMNEDFVEHSVTRGKPALLTKMWVFNFPDGMTGIHTFTEHSYAACQDLVDAGYIPGPCRNPIEKVELDVLTVTVNFD
jgi:hypothetical protein